MISLKIKLKIVAETKQAAIVAQKTIERKIVAVVVEAAKSEICVKNINFFDFTMQLNL